ncbi:zf-B_box domain-containing protein/CCT domain-containing protein [Cephalotus follicularis]|uniref:Zf-B_box domain-containing protein/CCT domain-containing protein n=1 Tax=Cephalotus follicularis TaxID=3775 RepID=A0A1Q3D219_CEPFO|nr:zf-B_box domain-containing protein/CCT domain-containing protein [Cephalotus follicularis]
MIPNKNLANAVGGKTARACDGCIKKRARWYCAADDAFLCQACDSSVHSANPLARRHERVRLKTASFKISCDAHEVKSSAPSWFTRKARTPRHGKPASHVTREFEEAKRNQSIPLVPEVGVDETSHEENEEEHLLYRVPIFDPFLAELSTSITSNEAVVTAFVDTETTVVGEPKALFCGSRQQVDGLQGFLPSDMDLEEFAADMESLLGRGLENETFGMEELGLTDCKNKDMRECCLGSQKVKLEEEEEEEVLGLNDQCQVDIETDMAREPFEFSFDYDSPATCGEEDDKMKGEVAVEISGEPHDDDDETKKKKILLRLDYEAVITAWASQGSPWTNGQRPDFDLDKCWPNCMGTCGMEVLHHPYGELGGMEAHHAMADGGREARVSRYREKRRTRLFSKKIRYEVRKLNAEKRPRMKGRFVKRSSFAGPAFPLLNK